MRLAGTAVTVEFTGFSQWVVPAGVTSITVEAYGAQGGGSAGGRGGLAKGTIAVTPGETLSVSVGTEAKGGVGGWNGGGTGGFGDVCCYSGPGFGGGGPVGRRNRRQHHGDNAIVRIGTSDSGRAGGTRVSNDCGTGR
jgi:hypothetical protein